MKESHLHRITVWRLGRALVAQLPVHRSMQEVAAIIGCSIQTVQNIETRALGKVALRLRGMEA
jgi:DNA-binding CsgD family transcriptional regulator